MRRKGTVLFNIVLIYHSACDGKGETTMILRSLILAMHRVVGGLLLSDSAHVWRC